VDLSKMSRLPPSALCGYRYDTGIIKWLEAKDEL
jgi:hypothetical protein